MRSGAGRWAALGAVGALVVLTGCGSSSAQVTSDRADAVAVSEPGPTTAPTTTTPEPTTTTIALPVPVPAPPPDAVEPEVVVGTIEIPRLGVSAYLFEGISDGTLDRGPGHWPGTAMPGQLGNVVVAGHRVSKHRVFRHLDQLQPGDEVRFTSVDGQFTYRVTGSMVVLPTDTWIVSQTPQRIATLFACHPPGSTRERFVVFAELVP